MSLSGGRSNILNRAVDNLVRAGLAVVVAAGNNAVDACAESPASASFATTVGSTSPMDSLSTFSNFGKCLDIAAPGESILSAWHTGDRDGMYMMGTSMAAPHVAGVQALILSSLNSSGHWKKLTPLKLRSMLVLGATSGVISKVPKSTPNLMLFNNPPMIKI
jgi:subtilisin family serine protease